MRRFYFPRVYRHTAGPRRRSWLFGVEIVARPLHLKFGRDKVSPIIVQDVRSGLLGKGESVSVWNNYASRVCRGWNAFLVGCELVGASIGVPPEVLADQVEEHEWRALALLLRQSFQPELIEWDQPGRPARIPGLPAGAPDHCCIVV